MSPTSHATLFKVEGFNYTFLSLLPGASYTLSDLPSISVSVSPDPIPAYKSWQDENESGEAQLSPLAGRMLPLPLLPLEEDGEDEEEGEVGQDTSPSSCRSHPHLLARRFLDFGAHSAQRFLQQDSDATSPTKAQRYDEALNLQQRFWILFLLYSLFQVRAQM